MVAKWYRLRSRAVLVVHTATSLMAFMCNALLLPWTLGFEDHMPMPAAQMTQAAETPNSPRPFALMLFLPLVTFHPLDTFSNGPHPSPSCL